MAAAWLRARLAERGCTGVQVTSAGTAAVRGEGMPPQAEFALFGEGVCSRGGEHRSQPVTRDLMAAADFVVVMTRAHRSELERRFPEFAEKVVLLMELAGEEKDVADPFGGGSEEYIRCLEQMKPALSRLLERVAMQDGEERGRRPEENGSGENT